VMDRLLVTPRLATFLYRPAASCNPSFGQTDVDGG
jgi:hypothetical protein